MSSIHFASIPSPCLDLEQNIRQFNDRISQDGFVAPSALMQLQNSTVLQCVFGPSHIAFLLEDGRVCRLSYMFISNENSSDDDKSQSNSSLGDSSNKKGNSSPSVRSRIPLLTLRRYRSLNRGRGIPTSLTNRRPVPASAIPDDLINQCQQVLQGKSRQAIVRELQRTNLDVNLAVNNLLNRDDDGNEDEDATGEALSHEDLMNIFDNALQDGRPDDSLPLLVDEMFTLSSFRARALNRINRATVAHQDSDAASSSSSNPFFRKRFMDYLKDEIAQGSALYDDELEQPPVSASKKTVNKQAGIPIHFGDSLQFWIVRDEAPVKFVQIGAMHSELVALSDNGTLHQWRWSDAEPYFCAETPGMFHPKCNYLGLFTEKITLISACSIRASAVTESGKVATWVDETLNVVSSKLEQPAVLFVEFVPDKIKRVQVSLLHTCVETESGGLFWWGIMPLEMRKRILERYSCRNKRCKRGKQDANQELTVGSLVNVRATPYFQANCTGFTIQDGVPKVGQLLKDAWSLNDTCRFRLKTTLVSTAPKNSDRNSVDKGAGADMPPPPSPSSSTCSEQSGPTLVSPGLLKRKRPSTLPKDLDRKEEDWSLRQVVFVDEVKSVSVGRVLKVDDRYVVVKFPDKKFSEPDSFSSQMPVKDDLINLLNECNVFRKEDVFPLKSKNVAKMPDFFQRQPKRIVLDNGRMLTFLLDESVLHLLMLQKDNSLIYNTFSIATGKMNKGFTFETSVPSFLGHSRNDIQLHRLYGSGPLLVLDGNRTIYPMNKNCATYSIREPLWPCLPPVTAVALGQQFFSIGNVKHSSTLLAVCFRFRPLLINILRCDRRAVQDEINRLDAMTNEAQKQQLVAAIINDRVDGGCNIVHTAVRMCMPVVGKRLKNNAPIDTKVAAASSTSASARSFKSGVRRINSRSRTVPPPADSAIDTWSINDLSIDRPVDRPVDASRYQSPTFFCCECECETTNDNVTCQNCGVRLMAGSVGTNRQDTVVANTSYETVSLGVSSGSELCEGPYYLPPVTQSPAKRRESAEAILNMLCYSTALRPHIRQLLCARNANNHTPFMQAVSGRAYAAALIIYRRAYTLASTAGDAQPLDQNVFMQMIYPPGSAVDDNPLYTLCCNDTCSYTWTGPDHINQDIFECRTCGLQENLCCCTECARVCHKGHDCQLKRTSPTAYCDCWEKCQCKALAPGDTQTREDLLKRLLADTDLVKLPNSRKEHILMFLANTVARQLVEQSQFQRTAARQPPPTDDDIAYADNQPPKFSAKALRIILEDWVAVKTMIYYGMKNRPTESIGSDNVIYLEAQDGTSWLDKFMHCLISKCCSPQGTKDPLDTLLQMLAKALHDGRTDERRQEATSLARRFVRSVGRIYITFCLEISPLEWRRAKPSLEPVRKCERIFAHMPAIAAQELTQMALALITPVRLGVARPTLPFALCAQLSDANGINDELFDVAPMSPSAASSVSNRHDAMSNVTFDLTDAANDAPVDLLVDNMGEDMGDDESEQHSDDEQHSERPDGEVEAGGGRESDLDLDLLAESDSDSESNAGSVHQSEMTAATVGSGNTGALNAAYFSDADVPSSVGDDDHSDDSMSDYSTEFAGVEHYERNTSFAAGQRVVPAPQQVQWAVHRRDPPAPSQSSTSAARAAAGGIHHLIDLSIQNSFGRPAPPIGTDNSASISFTAVNLARAFTILIKQVRQLLHHSGITGVAVDGGKLDEIHAEIDAQLRPVWDWVATVLDSTEAQLRFGSALFTANRRGDSDTPHWHAPPSQVAAVRRRGDTTTSLSSAANARSKRGRHPVAGDRTDFLQYALSLMRQHNSEHSDTVPILDVLSLRHVAYVFDCLAYYLRQSVAEASQNGSASSASHRCPVKVEPTSGETTTGPDNDDNAGEFDTAFHSTTAGNGLEHQFLKRSDSTLNLGCIAPDPVNTPLGDSLPLAYNPHLLTGNALREDLFKFKSPFLATSGSAALSALSASDIAAQSGTPVCSLSSSSSTTDVTVLGKPVVRSMGLLSRPSTPRLGFPAAIQPSGSINSAASCPCKVLATQSVALLTPNAPGSHQSVVRALSNAAPQSMLRAMLPGTSDTQSVSALYAPPVLSTAASPAGRMLPSVCSSTIVQPSLSYPGGAALSPPPLIALPSATSVPLALLPVAPPNVNLVALDQSHSVAYVDSYPQLLPDALMLNMLRPPVHEAALLGPDAIHQPPVSGSDFLRDFSSNASSSQQAVAIGSFRHSAVIHSTSRDTVPAPAVPLLAVPFLESRLDILNTIPQPLGPSLVSVSGSDQPSTSSEAPMESSVAAEAAHGGQIKTKMFGISCDWKGRESGAMNSGAVDLSIPSTANAGGIGTTEMEARDAAGSAVALSIASVSAAASRLLERVISFDALCGRWSLTLELFGRIFCDDVANEPGSFIRQLGGFPVRETLFRREMERLRSTAQQKELSLLRLSRDRAQLIQQTVKFLNSAFNNRLGISPPLVAERVKVTFDNEPGEGSGLARSFYTAFGEAILASEPLPPLESCLAGCKTSRIELMTRREPRRVAYSERPDSRDAADSAGSDARHPRADGPPTPATEPNDSATCHVPPTYDSVSVAPIRFPLAPSFPRSMSSGASFAPHSNLSGHAWLLSYHSPPFIMPADGASPTSDSLSYQWLHHPVPLVPPSDSVSQPSLRVSSSHSEPASSSGSIGVALPSRSYPRPLFQTIQMMFSSPNIMTPMLLSQMQPSVPSSLAQMGAGSSSNGAQLAAIGMRLYPMVQAINAEHASKITGMLLQLPLDTLNTLQYEDRLSAYVADALAIIEAHERQLQHPPGSSGQPDVSSNCTGFPMRFDRFWEPPSVDESPQPPSTADGAPSLTRRASRSFITDFASTSLASYPHIHSVSSAPPATLCFVPPPTTIAADLNSLTAHPDDEPLFWQPGKRGFYSPRPGRGSSERMNAFRTVGRVIGLCLLHNEVSPIVLTRPALKFILGRQIRWHDMAFFDATLYESLRQLLAAAADTSSECCVRAEHRGGGSESALAVLAQCASAQLTAMEADTSATTAAQASQATKGDEGQDPLQDLDLTYSVQLCEEEGGRTVELIRFGHHTTVTKHNVADYVARYCWYRMVTVIHRCLVHLRNGVFDVLPNGSLERLTAEDLRLLLNGVPDISVATLISYTSFSDESGCKDEAKVKQLKRWFWHVTDKMTPIQRQELLHFWTGSPVLPASEEGFQPMPSVTIRPHDDQHLPTANTCISRLYLPMYSSRGLLRQKLLTAIKTKSFGFV